MPSNKLPAIYVPPAGGDGIALAVDLLAIARASPEHAATLSRVVCLLLGGLSAPAVGNAVAALAPTRAKKTKAVKSAPAQLPPPAAAKATTGGAVEVCTDPENESVTFGGKTMEVSGEQAQFTLLLVRAMPNPVGRDFLEKKLFPGRSGESARAGLNVIIGPTRTALAGIGLDVHTVRSVGIVLRPLESA